MQKSLFVAGLDFSITSEDLKELFSQYGTVVNAKVATDFGTGRSKGFGFMDMATAEDAAKCIQMLNDTTHMNRKLAVRIKEEQPRKSFGGGNSNNRSNNKSW